MENLERSNKNENEKANEGFKLTYSAREQAEIKKIREKYTSPAKKEDSETKMDTLRRLDKAVNDKATAVALVFGIVGVLVMGFGMSLAMSELGEILGAYRHLSMILGIVIGLAGGCLAGIAYPIYGYILARERKKIAPEIIRLTDELMK